MQKSIKNKKSKYGQNKSRIDSLLAKKAQRKRHYLFLIITTLVLSILGLALIKEYSGMASFDGEGGFIYELNFYFEGEADMWSGMYGIALRLDQYTSPWKKTVWGAQIQQGIFLFHCLQNGISHEIYASLANESEIDWDSLEAATPADVDTFLGIDNTNYFSAANMFTQIITVSVGPNNYTVPATYTLVYNQTGSTRYSLGILKDGLGNLVFVAPINETLDFCYYGGVCNFQMLLPVRNGSGHNETYNFFADPFDTCQAGEIPPYVDYTTIKGNVSSASSGERLPGTIVVVGNRTSITDSLGSYTVVVPIGEYYIFAIKQGYNTYYNTVRLTQPNITYYHNIIMTVPKVGDYKQPSGEGKLKDKPETEESVRPIVERPAMIETVDYLISISEINRKIRQGNFIQEVIYFISTISDSFNLEFSIVGDVAEIIQLDKTALTLEQSMKKVLTLTIFGKGEPRVLTGNLTISGNINSIIPIRIEIIDKELLPVEALLIDVQPYRQSALVGSDFKFRVNLQNLLTDQQYPVKIVYTLQDVNSSTTYWSYEENAYILTSLTRIHTVKLPPEMGKGDYVITVTAHYLGLSSASSEIFEVVEPFYMHKLFGIIPVWMLLLFVLIVGVLLLAIAILKKQIKAKKKYKMAVDLSDLPKEGPLGIFVGKIAETPHNAYFDMAQLKMHSIIAGSTGSGKSFTAQVIAEELLDKNVAVIVFDPTAQWTGMLRKAQDKSILSNYSRFGMKKADAKAFNGGIRQITNPFEEIELSKYIKPGEIQIFAINKLEPEDIEVFVSNTIRQVFKQNFGESKELKFVMVYDEVHRLLPKFGGSGIGFLQLERGLREFRKWGIGIMMISHVLNDFVDQARANISTQVQMKTRDENDLERIRLKHGHDIFRSMVRTKVGTGLVVNADYNKGEPYFVEFRPIKHELMRLSEEEIQKYNKYNHSIDQIEYEIAQLDELKQDTFNLNLELKLLVKKLKEGSFHVVDIYLEEVNSELEKAWKSLNKKPKQKQSRLIDKKEIEKEIKKAEEERRIYISEQQKQQKKFKLSTEGNTEKHQEIFFGKKVAFENALSFDNGATVLSLEELLDSLEGMTEKTFSKHVNNKKNQIADWVSSAINSKEISKKIRNCTSKESIISLLKSLRENSEWFKDKQ